MAPVLLLLPPPELGDTDGVTRMVERTVVVNATPLDPVVTSTEVRTEVDVVEVVGGVELGVC
jgi:hypothetical protein